MESSADAGLAASSLAGPPDLAGRAKLAVAWATGLQFFRDIVQFGFTLALVRLLPAEAYGQFGLLTTLLTFFTYYSFREFLDYTLQARDGEQPHYQDHFTAGTVVQAIIVVAVNVVALAFRWFPAYAPVSPVLHVMSLLFVIDLPAEFRTRMLERQLDWRRLRVLQGTGFLAGGLLSLAMAIAGLGVWALIIPTLVVPIPFIYDLFVRDKWRPAWTFSWERFQPAWRFGLTRMLTLTLLAIASVTESLTLAGVLGFALLGIYGRALGLAQLLCGRLAGLLSIAIYPVLTRVTKSSDAYRRAGALYLRAVTWTVIPAAVIATQLASPIVRLLYGAKWIGAIQFVPWAMAGAALGAIVQTAYTILLANGQQRACVAVDACRMAGVLLALLIALPAGPGRYLAAVAVVQMISLVVVSRFLWRTGSITERALIQAVLPAAFGTALAGAAMAGLLVTVGAGVASVWPTVLAVAGFVVIYVSALRVAFKATLAEVVAHLPQSRAIARALRLGQE